MTRRPIFTVLRDIQEFSLVEGNWRRLDELLDELWSVGATEGSLPILFGVFERFPQEDGSGLLWSIVHGVESLSFDYEPALRKSLQRTPSFMGKVMLQRLERTNES